MLKPLILFVFVFMALTVPGRSPFAGRALGGDASDRPDTNVTEVMAKARKALQRRLERAELKNEVAKDFNVHIERMEKISELLDASGTSADKVKRRQLAVSELAKLPPETLQDFQLEIQALSKDADPEVSKGGELLLIAIRSSVTAMGARRPIQIPRRYDKKLDVSDTKILREKAAQDLAVLRLVENEALRCPSPARLSTQLDLLNRTIAQRRTLLDSVPDEEMTLLNELDAALKRLQEFRAKEEPGLDRDLERVTGAIFEVNIDPKLWKANGDPSVRGSLERRFLQDLKWTMAATIAAKKDLPWVYRRNPEELFVEGAPEKLVKFSDLAGEAFQPLYVEKLADHKDPHYFFTLTPMGRKVYTECLIGQEFVWNQGRLLGEFNRVAVNRLKALDELDALRRDYYRREVPLINQLRALETSRDAFPARAAALREELRAQEGTLSILLSGIHQRQNLDDELSRIDCESDARAVERYRQSAKAYSALRSFLKSSGITVPD